MTDQHQKRIRFVIVGTSNTLIDVSIYTFLQLAGLPLIISNIISTSSGLVFSYFANHTYTFKLNTRKHPRQFMLFVIITLIGLWLIQPTVILLVTDHVHAIMQIYRLPHVVFLILPKIIATCLTLVWNYCWYNFYIFKKGSE